MRPPFKNTKFLFVIAIAMLTSVSVNASPKGPEKVQESKTKSSPSLTPTAVYHFQLISCDALHAEIIVLPEVRYGYTASAQPLYHSPYVSRPAAFMARNSC